MYYDMIHERAVKTYTGPTPNAENYNIWIAHWFATAEIIHDEFEALGLICTAAYLRDLIDRQKV